MTQQGWQPPRPNGPQGYPGGGYPPNGFPPSQFPYPAPPPPQKRGAFRVMIVVLAVLLIILIAVVTVGVVKHLNSSDGSPAGGSSAGGSSKGGGSGDDALKVPFTAQFNSWLSDAYASGMGSDWKVDGQPVGTSSDRSKIVISKRREQQRSSDGQWTFVAHSTIYDVLTGKPVHEFTDMDCYESLPAIDGKLTCIRLLPPGSAHKEAVGQLDIASGKFTAFYAADFAISAVRVIGIRDNRIYAHTQSELGYYFIVFDANSTPETNTVIWQSDKIPDTVSPCVLLGDYIGCQDKQHLSVFSAKDGSPGIVVDDPRAVHVVWTDEAVIWGGHYDEEFTVSYYDGKTDVTKDFPYKNFSHEDMVLLKDEMPDLARLEEVDAEGNEVVRRAFRVIGPDAKQIVATGAELQMSIGDTILSSTTGKVMLLDLGRTSTWQLVLPDGTQVGTVGTENGLVKLVDGIVVEVSFGDQTTVVHPPAK